MDIERSSDKTGITRYFLPKDADDSQYGLFDKPLPCFGCGIGWFSFLVGFLCPPMWYYATILYLGNYYRKGSYYRKDPRERGGLAASAIAVSISLLIGSFYGILILRNEKCLSNAPMPTNLAPTVLTSTLLT